METITLQQAFWWECPACGAGNFAKAVVAEPTDDEKEEAFRQYHDLEAWQPLPPDWNSFDLVKMPICVKCDECQHRFKTQEA